LSQLIEMLNYKQYLIDNDPIDGKVKWENVLELERIASFSTNESLLSFLQNIEIINGHVNDSSSSVCITTIHAAKGLEWDYVFIPGLEEGILPHYRADDKKKREEEKRLLFVACTRARKKLYLLRCKY